MLFHFFFKPDVNVEELAEATLTCIGPNCSTCVHHVLQLPPPRSSAGNRSFADIAREQPGLLVGLGVEICRKLSNQPGIKLAKLFPAP